MYICKLFEITFEKPHQYCKIQQFSSEQDLSFILPLLGLDLQNEEGKRHNLKEKCIFGIKSKANKKYISAGNNYDYSLVANRDFIGDWEKFCFSKNFDGSYSIKCFFNSKFLSSKHDDETTNLKANKSKQSTEEKFYVLKNSDDTVSFKSLKNGKYVSVDDFHYSILSANREYIDFTCKFRLKKYGFKQIFCNRLFKLLK